MLDMVLSIRDVETGESLATMPVSPSDRGRGWPHHQVVEVPFKLAYRVRAELPGAAWAHFAIEGGIVTTTHQQPLQMRCCMPEGIIRIEVILYDNNSHLLGIWKTSSIIQFTK